MIIQCTYIFYEELSVQSCTYLHYTTKKYWRNINTSVEDPKLSKATVITIKQAKAKN